jgi:hypothetical protein
MAYENRRYLIIPTSITGSIDFSQVGETSAETLRLSVDGTKTFVKYEVVVESEDRTVTYTNTETGEEETHTITAGVYGRPSIYSPEYPEYTHSQILEILGGEEWTVPMEME